MTATIGSAGVAIFANISSAFGRTIADATKQATTAAGKLFGGVTITATLNAAAAKLGFADLTAQRDELNRNVASINVGVNDAAAKAKLLDLVSRLDALNRMKIDPSIDLAGAAKLSAQMFRLQAQADKLNSTLANGNAGGAAGLVPGGGGSGAAASGGGVLSALPSPVVLGAIAAGLAALPFAAQVAGAGIVAGLGAGLAGIAILGASKTKSVQDSFAKLKTSASSDAVEIGASFVGPLNSILSTARSVMNKLTPVFAGAAKAISVPFQAFGDALLKAFNQPAVKQSIAAVATSFGAILKAVTPGLATGIGQVAAGITKIASAVTANPKAFADFTGFLFATVGGVLTAIAALIRFASYIEAKFIPVFDGARHEISHVWADIATDTNNTWKAIWNDTIGQAIRNTHILETDYNDYRHFIAVVLDGIRTDSVTAWNTIWANTVSRVSNGITETVNFFRALPGKILGSLGNAGATLRNWGAGVINGLLSGMESVVGAVWNFIKGIPGKILSFLGIKSPPQWSIDAGVHIMTGVGIGMAQAVSAAAKATAALKASVSASIPLGSGALSGLAGGTNEAVMQSVAAAHGWTSANGQWQAMFNVEMREAGFSLTATNPSSGAYGEAQFINGPSEYAQYGGNSTTAIGQATAMANYIAQRYGNPAAAWAHEQAFGWYGKGTNSAARGLAIVGEFGPELVRFGGGEQVTPMSWGGKAAGDGASQPAHVHLHVSNYGVLGSQVDVDQWLTSSLNRLARTGHLTQAVRTASGGR